MPLPWPFEGPVDARRFTVGFGPPLRAWLAPLRACRREDVCAWLQRGLTQDLLALARHEVATVGGEVLALAGGVFANVRLNQALAEGAGAARLHVFPHMGDGGLAAGAALSVAHRDGGVPRERLPHVFLGPSPEDVGRVLDGVGAPFHVEHPASPDVLTRRVAALLAAGKVVAVCRGPMEYGPRALGHRSILAPANDMEVTMRLNASLDRSDFMPFAPVILSDGHEDWIDLPARARHAATFMTVTAHARPRMRAALPAAVHVDGTLRPQIVEAGTQPFLHAVLTDYHTLTGLPAVLNTSFNLHEEPIVESAAQALATFERARLDALVLGDALVVRP